MASAHVGAAYNKIDETMVLSNLLQFYLEPLVFIIIRVSVLGDLWISAYGQKVFNKWLRFYGMIAHHFIGRLHLVSVANRSANSVVWSARVRPLFCSHSFIMPTVWLQVASAWWSNLATTITAITSANPIIFYPGGRLRRKTPSCNLWKNDSSLILT